MALHALLNPSRGPAEGNTGKQEHHLPPPQGELLEPCRDRPRPPPGSPPAVEGDSLPARPGRGGLPHCARTWAQASEVLLRGAVPRAQEQTITRSGEQEGNDCGHPMDLG